LLVAEFFCKDLTTKHRDVSYLQLGLLDIRHRPRSDVAPGESVSVYALLRRYSRPLCAILQTSGKPDVDKDRIMATGDGKFGEV